VGGTNPFVSTRNAVGAVVIITGRAAASVAIRVAGLVDIHRVASMRPVSPIVPRVIPVIKIMAGAGICPAIVE
jgi:hypothetical protein